MDLTEAVILRIKQILAETDLAIKIQLNSGIYWIPKSQLRVIGNKYYIPKWLAEEKGIKIREDTQYESVNNNNDTQRSGIDD